MITPRFKTSKPPRQRSTGTAEARTATRRNARGRCQADGLHVDDCPGSDLDASFVAHRVNPGRQGGTYDPANMIWVYNGGTGLGAGGCHQNIHSNGRLARVLGLLSEGSDDPWHGIGIDLGRQEGFLQ